MPTNDEILDATMAKYVKLYQSEKEANRKIMASFERVYDKNEKNEAKLLKSGITNKKLNDKNSKLAKANKHLKENFKLTKGNTITIDSTNQGISESDKKRYDRIGELHDLCNRYEEHNTALAASNSFLQGKVYGMESRIKVMETNHQRNLDQIHESNLKMAELKSKHAERLKLIDTLKVHVNQLETKNFKLARSVMSEDNTEYLDLCKSDLAVSDTEVTRCNVVIENLEEEIKKLKEDDASRLRGMDVLRECNNKLEADIEENDKGHIVTLSVRDNRIGYLEYEVKTCEEKIIDLKNNIAATYIALKLLRNSTIPSNPVYDKLNGLVSKTYKLTDLQEEKEFNKV